jgi:hypothetical protein
VPPEQKGAILKEDIRAAAIAVVLVVAGLFWWQVTTLMDCRDPARTNTSVDKALFTECPQSGLYGAGNSLSAMLASLFPAAAAKQRPR